MTTDRDSNLKPEISGEINTLSSTVGGNSISLCGTILNLPQGLVGSCQNRVGQLMIARETNLSDRSSSV